MINRIYTKINNLFIITNQFYVVSKTIINKLFTKKEYFLLIVSKMSMKLNKNLKIGYFCTKPYRMEWDEIRPNIMIHSDLWPMGHNKER